MIPAASKMARFADAYIVADGSGLSIAFGPRPCPTSGQPGILAGNFIADALMR